MNSITQKRRHIKPHRHVGSYIPREREVELAGLIGAGLAEGASPWDVAVGREAEEEMARAFLPLVSLIARDFARASGCDRDDAGSFGREALVGLVRRYDPSRGARFATWAATRIRGNMMDRLEAEGDVIHVPRNRSRVVRRASREPAPAELDGAARDAQRARRVASLNKAAGGRRDGVGNGWRKADLYELLVTPPPGPLPIADELDTAIDALPAWYGEAVRLYYGIGREPLMMKEVGRVVGRCEARVSQAIAQACTLLRESLARKGVVR